MARIHERIRRFWARCLALFLAQRFDREFEAEAQTHIELATDECLRQGLPPSEAQRLARLKFGSMAAALDAHREARGLQWLEQSLYDARLSLRALRRDWSFTATAITLLATGLAANATVFTVMDAMLFRGFPLVRDNDRLAYLKAQYGTGACCVTLPDFDAWRSQTTVFEGLAYAAYDSPATFQHELARPREMPVVRITTNMFGLLGVAPARGRDFRPEDERPGSPAAAIVSHRFWVSRFSGRPDIVGTVVRVNDMPTTIVGVMPPGFDFAYEADLWLPLIRSFELEQRVPRPDLVFGRLKPATTLQQARVELEAVNQRLSIEYPATNRNVTMEVNDYSKAFNGPDAPMIYGSLWAGAWFVFLVACANLANLTLARTVGLWPQFATKVALGATRLRMARQLAAESVMLTMAAGLIAWALTVAAVGRWAAATASPFQVLDYRVNATTIEHIVATSIAAAFLISFVPIWRLAQFGAVGSVTDDVRGAMQESRSTIWAASLVAGQMALAIVLLSGSGVLVRSLLNIVRADTGVRASERVLVGSVVLPPGRYETADARIAYFDRLTSHLASAPGIEAVALASHLPVNWVPPLTFEGEGPFLAGGQRSAQMLAVGSGYFEVVGASTIAGRTFRENEAPSDPPVAIVNQRFVELFWPGEQVIGRRVRVVNQNRPPGPWRTIVGVVSNVMQAASGDATRQHFVPLVYVALRQQPQARPLNNMGQPFRGSNLLVRSRTRAEDVAAAVRNAVVSPDPDAGIEDLQSLTAHYSFDRDRMDLEHADLGKQASVAPLFAGIALLVAAVGLYAIVARAVNRRRKELGVRRAIGADDHDIRMLVYRDGLRPVGVGLIAGLLASFAVNRLLQSQLVGVSPYDPFTLIAAPLVLVSVAVAACYVPTRRALRVPPAIALRQE